MKRIEKAVVFGSGSMGSGIAALLASTGIQVTLLDIPEEGENRNARASKAVELQLKRGGFFHEKFAANVTPGNSEDHLDACAEADWVIEAIFENLAAKRELYAKIQPHLGATAILSSNTSTLRLSDLTEELEPSVRERFYITHFFNPPRVMPLVELIGENPEELVEIIERQLGKRALICRDTPGFVANRIGNFWMASAAHIALERGVSIEHADAVFSKPFGIPRTGVFGLFDYVGLQLVPGVWGTFLEQLPKEDAYHNYDVVHHPMFEGLLERGYTGRTGPSGFYRGRDEVVTPDFTYQPKQRVEVPKDPKELLTQDEYARDAFLEFLRYCCEHLDEIADSPQDIDHGMEWGYSWKKGPFALADQIGVDFLASLYEQQPGGAGVPAKLQEAVEHGGFYTNVKERQAGSAENPGTQHAATIETLPNGIMVLHTHSKMGALSPEVLEALAQVVEEQPRGLVITHAHPNAFSAGAHLPTLAATPKEYAQQGIKVLRALHYAPFPVVAAAQGLALGGGAELLLQADAVVAHVDLVIGFPERNVGVFPGWGGPLEHLRRLIEAGVPNPHEQAFAQALDTKPIRGAYQAQELHLLRPTDIIEASPLNLIDSAVTLADKLAANYTPPQQWEVPLFEGTLSEQAAELGSDPTAELDADQAATAAVASLLTAGASSSIGEDQWIEKSVQALLDVIANPANKQRLAEFLASQGIK